MKEIEEEIKRRQKRLNITQKTLSELAGIGINTLTKIESGEANPTIEVLDKILTLPEWELM